MRFDGNQLGNRALLNHDEHHLIRKEADMTTERAFIISRVAPIVKEKLSAEAERNMRSISAEIAWRLKRSFEEGDRRDAAK